MRRETVDLVPVTTKLRDGDRSENSTDDQDGMQFSDEVRERMLVAAETDCCSFTVSLQMDDGMRFLLRDLNDQIMSTYNRRVVRVRLDPR